MEVTPWQSTGNVTRGQKLRTKILWILGIRSRTYVEIYRDKTSAVTSLHFDALDVLNTEGVSISLLSAIVCDPLGFVLRAWTAYQSQNVDMWDENTNFEQPHGPYVARCIKGEAVVDASRDHQEVTRANVAANPRLSGVLWEDRQRPLDRKGNQGEMPTAHVKVATTLEDVPDFLVLVHVPGIAWYVRLDLVGNQCGCRYRSLTRDRSS